MNKTPHYRAFKVKFLGATNNLSSRVKIIDELFETTVTLISNPDTPLDQAVEYLIKRGFKVMSYGMIKNYYIIMCNNWKGEQELLELK